MEKRHQLAVRINARNKNHHLWLNNGIWWLHYTIHLSDFTKKRVRRSMQCKCADAARVRRDYILQERATSGDGETAERRQERYGYASQTER